MRKDRDGVCVGGRSDAMSVWVALCRGAGRPPPHMLLTVVAASPLVGLDISYIVLGDGESLLSNVYLFDTSDL